MKKFIVLAVILCAVIFPSSASANTRHLDEIVDAVLFQISPEEKQHRMIAGLTHAELLKSIGRDSKSTRNGSLPDPIDFTTPAREPEQTPEKSGSAFYAVFVAALTVGLIALFLAYKRSKDRQFIVEHSLAIWLASFVGGKNFWLLIFCVVSLVTCLVYVPYNLISSNNAAVAIKTAHSTIFEPPKDFNPRLTKIDYEAITFREVLILLGCCAGATTCKLLRRRQDDWH